MGSAYRVLAWLVALGVAVQAAAIAFAFFGLLYWVNNEGGVFDAASVRSRETHFTGSVGFMLHAINGEMIVPLLAVLLLIVSFFAKVQGGVLWGALTVLAVAVQVLLGNLAANAPALGPLHGLLAIVVVTLALIASQRRPAPPAVAAPEKAPSSTGVF
jgi:hypothetical protein